MECGDNSLQENAFGFSEEDEPLDIVDNVPQDRKSDSFLIENICDTVLSAESLCLDWDQPPSSSGSTEPIQETFKDMGIDNTCWYDDEHAECPTASLPPTNDPFTAMAGPVAARTEACVEGDGNLLPDPSLISTPNNQLVLYKPPEEDSAKDENAMAGCCGLRNLGNTCFMSAGIQCLAATPPLVRFFLSEKSKFVKSSGESNEEASCSNGVASKLECYINLTHDFARLLSEMWAGKFGCISPHYFKRSLSVMHPQFKDYRQHDCQEFLTLLLDSLHEQLNNVMKSDCEEERNQLFNPDEAVAGCSQGDSIEALRSNTDLAFLLANSKNGRIEKNCLEQHLSPSPPVPPTSPNLSPRPDFAEINFIPNSLMNTDDASFIPRSLLGIDMTDYWKDAKTPNINVLAPQLCEPKPNNLIKFDSEKFSPTNRKMPTASNATPRSVRNMTGIRNSSDVSLGEDHNDLSDDQPQKDSAEDVPLLNGKRLKQTNLLNGLSMNYDGDLDDEASSNTNKRLKLVSNTNINGDIDMMDSEEDNSVDKREEMEANAFWQKHLEANRSIVVDSFQGQFKSTVICDVCKHVSITYEPFMYLSVPLPHALERQICVIYLPADVSIPPMRVLLTLKKMDNIKALLFELVKVVGLPAENNITVCEVLENHISKVLEPGHQLRFLNGELRTIYAIEMLPPPESCVTPPRLSPIPSLESPFCVDDEPTQPIDLRPNAGLESNIITVPTEAEVNQEMAASPSTSGKSQQWPMCNICLEESDMKTQLKTHEVCGCVVCINCLEMWQTKEEGNLRCPLCRVQLNPELDLTTFTASDKKIVRVMQITVVFRLDILGEECSNNKKSMRLIGHPRLVKLPNIISGKVLYETLQHLAPNVEFQILLVGGKGTYCSRCMYNKHCVGCVLCPDSPEIIIHPDDSLAIRLMGPLDPFTEQNLPFSSSPVDHESLKQPRWNDPLTIHDCLHAFSEIEELDKENPWYCPKCRTNQCATKTLTVWRYPDILIIYLKRFVFNERSISKLDNKVTFPLTGLRLDQPGSRSRVNIYNLYSVVCHFGGASAGHYTAFAKHPRTSEWYNYNDETTTKKPPQEEDYSNGYILFYQRENLPDLFT